MTFDPAHIAPAAKAKYIEIGEDFGSDDVLSQLDRSISGADTYATNLVLCGWPATQTQKMRVLRDLIHAALVQRAAAKIDKKTTNAALRNAILAGKNARAGARSALMTARTELFEEGNLDAVNEIDSALAVTAESGADSKLLAEQLGTLESQLTRAEIAPILGDGAAPLQDAVSVAATALDVAIKSKGRPYGTPPETEHVDLLDGAAVVLLRTLRKAGRAAARASGHPDIADAFQLSELYRTTHESADDAKPPPTPAAGR